MNGLTFSEHNAVQATTPTVAKRISTNAESLTIVLNDRVVTIPWQQCSEKLATATNSQRGDAVLSPGGYGIHWPQIDEDLSVNGLILALNTNANA